MGPDKRRRLGPDHNTFVSPALSFTLKARDGRARQAVLQLPHAQVQTPCFMPVGTNGSIKMIPVERMRKLGPDLILGNTYHLGARVGKQRMGLAGGLHKFMGWPKNLLTDSGGFQMVSLLSLANITEEGVEFTHPTTKERMLLTPEMSMQIQNAIGADVMMALDDVVSAVEPYRERVATAVERTSRWLDRCVEAHANPTKQNLWAIVQGGLHDDLRRESMKQIIARDLPGYAIGGLSGGEAKNDFWRMVELCTKPDGQGLPENKSRYLMGVGYPLDLVVCVALGCDLFDCVYPTRTARFGTALTDWGTMRLKRNEYKEDYNAIDATCDCDTCKKYTRAFLHATISRQPSTQALLSEHNIRYMHNLGLRMREAISDGTFKDFVKSFVTKYFSKNDAEVWVRDALTAAGIPEISKWVDFTKASTTTSLCGSTPHHVPHVSYSKKNRVQVAGAQESI